METLSAIPWLGYVEAFSYFTYFNFHIIRRLFSEGKDGGYVLYDSQNVSTFYCSTRYFINAM